MNKISMPVLSVLIVLGVMQIARTQEVDLPPSNPNSSSFGQPSIGSGDFGAPSNYGTFPVDGQRTVKPRRAVTRTRSVEYVTVEEIPAEDLKRLEEFQAAVLAMRKSHDSPEERTKARVALEALVLEQMDRDLEEREKQLAAIEAQAKTLREQLEQRKSSKPEFVKLIMLMIENPAAGIGLPAEWMNSLNPVPNTFGTAAGSAYAEPSSTNYSQNSTSQQPATLPGIPANEPVRQRR